MISDADVIAYMMSESGDRFRVPDPVIELKLALADDPGYPHDLMAALEGWLQYLVTWVLPGCSPSPAGTRHPSGSLAKRVTCPTEELYQASLRQNVPVDLTWLQGKLRDRRRRQDAWQAQVRAQNIDHVNQLANLSDAELIATAPGIPNMTHQMEMERRLKNSIDGLTIETRAGRRSSDRLTIAVLVFTVAIAVLTAVLVVRAV